MLWSKAEEKGYRFQTERRRRSLTAQMFEDPDDWDILSLCDIHDIDPQISNDDYREWDNAGSITLPKFNWLPLFYSLLSESYSDLCFQINRRKSIPSPARA